MHNTASQIEIRNIYPGLRAFTGQLELQAKLEAILSRGTCISLLVCRKTHNELSGLSSTPFTVKKFISVRPGSSVGTGVQALGKRVWPFQPISPERERQGNGSGRELGQRDGLQT